MALTLIICQIALLLVAMKLIMSPGVSRTLSVSLLFLIVIWYVSPVIINMCFWDKIDSPSIVDYDLFLAYATLESLMLLLCMCFLLRSTPYFRLIMDSEVARTPLLPGLALLIVYIGVGSTWVLSLLGRVYLGDSYLEQNAFNVVAEGTETFNNLGSVAFAHNLLASFCCACLVQRWPQTVQSRFLYSGVVVWIAMTVAYHSLSGSRVILIMPLFLLVLYGLARQWPKGKMTWIFGTGALLTITVGGVLAIVIAQYRSGEMLDTTEVAARSTETIGQGLSADLAMALLTNIVTKFDSFSTGALLVKENGAAAGGWRPYWGSLLAVVPRALLPLKPVPGSADETYLGHPSRLVAASMGMYYSMGNVQVSPAAVSIWQFAYLGLAVLLVLNVAHLYLINSLLLSESVAIKALGVFMIGIPTLWPLFTSGDYITMDTERVLVVYGAFLVCHRILRSGSSVNWSQLVGAKFTKRSNLDHGRLVRHLSQARRREGTAQAVPLR